MKKWLLTGCLFFFINLSPGTSTDFKPVQDTVKIKTDTISLTIKKCIEKDLEALNSDIDSLQRSLDQLEKKVDSIDKIPAKSKFSFWKKRR